ncbi:MAG: YtxH domain-containing protein [Anaerolineae bacterium]
MAEGNDFDNFVGGLVLGALLGAAFGLILAPAPGRDLRRRLKEQSVQLRSQASKRADEIQAKGQAIIATQKTRFQEAIEVGKQAAALRREELVAQLGNPDTAGESIELPTHPG